METLWELIANNAGQFTIVVVPMAMIWTKVNDLSKKIDTMCKNQREHLQWHLNKTKSKDS